MPEPRLRDRALAALRACGAERGSGGGAPFPVVSPIDGEELVELGGAGVVEVAAAAEAASAAFGAWRAAPPEARAAAVGAIGEALAGRRAELAELVAIETGKPIAAAGEEVGAAAAACVRAAAAAGEVAPLPAPSADLPEGSFAVLRPLGPVAVLGSFELPLLGWAGAAPAALACGCPVVWDPVAPLVATAVDALVAAALRSVGLAAPGLHAAVPGGPDAAEALAVDPAIELVARPAPPAPGTAIVAPAADLGAVAREAALATAAGAGRSPAALRVLLAHDSIAADLEWELRAAFAALAIGDPLGAATDLGPLRDVDAYRGLLDAVQEVEGGGGELLAGGEALEVGAFPAGLYAEPALLRASAASGSQAALRAPVLLLARWSGLDKALGRRDAASPGWSALLGGDPTERARFLAAPGSDRGFVAVGSCPTEADLSIAEALPWRSFTRPVVGRVD